MVQSDTGDVTQAANFVNLGNNEVTNTSATATGNNISASNTSGPLSVTDNQNNGSFVNAIAVETSYEYGGSTVSAYGVGNSVEAATGGPPPPGNIVQVNVDGRVRSRAPASVRAAAPASTRSSSSTAVGNSASGFACSASGGVMNIQNSQTNNGDVGATASIGLAAGSRSARSTATAIGNTATFYVSSPN